MKLHALLIGAAACASAIPSSPADAAIERTSVAIPMGQHEVRHTDQGTEVAIDGFGSLLVPGTPRLPSRIFAIAIPPGAEVIGVSCDVGGETVLPGKFDVAPAPLLGVIGGEDPILASLRRQAYERHHDAVYGSDDAYPARVAELVRRAGYRRYNLVDVRVTPFSYQPLSGRLVLHRDITVHVDYEMPDRAAAAPEAGPARTEAIARDLIVNHDAAAAWYPASRSGARGLHDYVIVTTDWLTESVAPLVEWETSKGRTVEVVTTSSISAGYFGYDLAEKIRNFLRLKYPSGQWGIEDVLFVGNYDHVPLRRTAQDIGRGMPETDYYYAELSQPDHLSWDADVDRSWGEDTDPIDFYAEVNVGRIPWSDPPTVQAICEKSVAYEQNHDPAFKKNILLLGAFFWNDDPHPQTDTAYLMEAIAARPWMDGWTKTRMYEQNEECSSIFPCDHELLPSNVMSVWPTGTYAFVNWAGHGTPESSHIYGLGMPAFITGNSSWSLNDDYPAIIFADACSNSDTDHLNIGQSMMRRGGVGFLGATKPAFGCPAWDDPSDGSTQSLDYYFTSHVTSGNYTLGEAHQQALRDMYTLDLWSVPKYEVFEWGAIWGNPNLRMGDPAAPSCPEDLNGDNVVDVSDFLDLLAGWGTPAGDVDGDGDTGVTDFLALLALGTVSVRQSRD